MSILSIPKVSVGVPLYNGARFIRDALANIQSQTFSNFEVIISDNCSDDNSEEIAEKFCSSDKRFHLIRQQTNIGALANFHAVLDEARAPYFLWRAYDDLTDDRYLERLLHALEGYPEYDIAVPRVATVAIGGRKRKVRPVDRLQKRWPSIRNFRLLYSSNAGWFYGLMRTDYARNAIRTVCDEYGHLWAWDHLMLFEAIVRESIVFEDSAIFFHRLERSADKASRPMENSDLQTLLRDYKAYCENRIREVGLSWFEEKLLTVALAYHMNKRVVPFKKLGFSHLSPYLSSRRSKD